MTRKAGIVEIKTTSYEEAVFRSDSPPVNRKESCIHTCDILGSHYLHEHQPKRVGVTTGLIKKNPNVGLRAGFGSLWVTRKRKDRRLAIRIRAISPSSSSKCSAMAAATASLTIDRA